jgi:hypothetical protein
VYSNISLFTSLFFLFLIALLFTSIFFANSNKQFLSKYFLSALFFTNFSLSSLILFQNLMNFKSTSDIFSWPLEGHSSRAQQQSKFYWFAKRKSMDFWVGSVFFFILILITSTESVQSLFSIFNRVGSILYFILTTSTESNKTKPTRLKILLKNWLGSVLEQ